MKQLLTIFILCCSQVIMAQVFNADTLQRKFEQYSLDHLQEKIFVHTDKNFYMAGEVAWFKIYTTDGSFNRPLDFSKVAYTEILDAENKVIFQSKIAITNAHGNGSFAIPFSVNTGNYQLRAYTSWMKNYDAEFYFQKQITIVNPLKKPVWKNIDTETKYEVQFFPEGGNFVNGIKNVLAIKVSDKDGNGVNSSGTILNKTNEVVCRFETLKFGMGHVDFTPAAGETYTAVVTTAGNIVLRSTLPAATAEGYAMHAATGANGEVSVTVSTNNSLAENMYLHLQTRQVQKKVITTVSKNGVAVFTFDKRILGEGISGFTVFNQAGIPVCERLYFNRPAGKLQLNVVPDSLVYNRRQQVKIDLASLSENNAVPADLSMSVALADSLDKNDDSHILSYLWLCSDLKGHIEDPDYYFEDTSAVASEAADNLMLTQGWRKFSWNNVLRSANNTPQYLAEADGHIISGTITNKNNNTPAKNITTYLSVAGRSFRTAITSSRNDGTIHFDLKPVFGSNEIIIQTNSRTDSIYNVDITNPFSEKYTATAIKNFELSPAMKNDLTGRSIGMQVQHVYEQDKWQRFISTQTDTTEFYGTHSKKYNLDDYTRFTTMEEVVREYVKEIRLRKNDGRYYFDVKTNTAESGFESDPLMLVDGLVVFDAGKIIAFDPLKIKSIDVVAQKYYLGSQVYNGIVSLSTYEGDLAGFNVDPSAIILEYGGMQAEREFYTPAYASNEQRESRLPDFRSLLYWNPKLETNAGGKATTGFYTGDVPGKYTIVTQGISQAGQAGYSKVSITVR